jgi:hypothetical protein
MIQHHINTLSIMLSLTDTRNPAEITRLNRLINHLQRLADELEWAPMRRTDCADRQDPRQQVSTDHQAG